MFPLPKMYSTRVLQRDYKRVIEEAKRTKLPALLVSNSRPEAVVLDIESYEELVRDRYPYDEEYVLREVAKSRKLYRMGKSKVLSSIDDLDR